MAPRKRKRRKKIRKRDIRLFLLMCAIAAAIGALLTLFYGDGGEVREMPAERLAQEYGHQSGKRSIDPSALEKAAGESDR